METKLRVTTYCSRGEKCISQVREKLYEWRVDCSEHDSIIEFLIEERYIDETRFARAYVNDKYRFNGWGRKKISLMLSAKGIDKATISEALLVIDDDLYLENLTSIIEKKNRTLKCDSDYECRSKLFNHAYSRGYESNLIVAVIDQCRG